MVWVAGALGLGEKCFKETGSEAAVPDPEMCRTEVQHPPLKCTEEKPSPYVSVEERR